MANNLLIVESPAKSKTLQGYLGKDYEILASYGHVRDLVPKSGAVEPDHDFKIHYTLIEKNKAHMEAIKKAAKKAKVILLATDQDREGEAISWHIKTYLEESGCLKGKTTQRIVFNQITKKAILEAIANPRELSKDLIDAQQARRVLDYLVGFNLSPLLWKKIRPGLSAGRVQSPALRLIVEREAAIEAFKPQEYWSIKANAQEDKQNFPVRLVEYQGEKLQQFSITNEEQASKIKKDCESVDEKLWQIASIKETLKHKEPPAPFITSTLLQESIKKLGLSSAKTMRTAQTLYEGINIGGEQVGLITYMRTDSYSIAKEAIDDIRSLITKKYGSNNLSKQVRSFKSSSKNDQEAHEAIRPTDVNKTPESLEKVLSVEQMKLYKMIWQRTIASQMATCKIKQVRADIHHSKKKKLAIFRANGNSVEFPGFLKAYQEGKDVGENEQDTDEQFLPNLKEGTLIALSDILCKQHFTEPPARYTEASLIKTLKEYDIGRPSTYASIITTLKDREYVILEQKRFTPTDTGTVVNRFLSAYFFKYVDYTFTAKLENELDGIARGEDPWKPILHEFWDTFSARVDEIEKTVQRKDVTEEKIDEKCPECKHDLVKKLGRNGSFIACSNFPDCKYTRSVNDDDENQNATLDRKCPECDHDLAIKQGRYGKFIGCSNYPDCKYIESLNKPEDTHVTCPKCESATLLKRRARKGNFFYSCQAYPKCKYIQSHEPVDKPCIHCKFPITMKKVTKRFGEQLVCPECKKEQN